MLTGDQLVFKISAMTMYRGIGVGDAEEEARGNQKGRPSQQFKRKCFKYKNRSLNLFCNNSILATRMMMTPRNLSKALPVRSAYGM